MDDFVVHATKLGWSGLSNEFHEVTQIPSNASHTFQASKQNAEKNRYKDVQCLDSSRVVLEYAVPPESDYINANWIRPESKDGISRKFIATQGPLEGTASDFWRMVYQVGEQGAPAIIMLCQCIEDGKQKSFQYWPTERGASKTYGCMSITNKKTEPLDRFTVHTLEVLPDGCSNSVIATLYTNSEWPDRGLPKSPMGLLRLLKNIRQNKLIPGPWIVHCSAGLGRTGTLIAIEVGMQQLFKDQNPNVKQIVRKIREQRPGSVMTAGQYVFIYAALLYYCHAKGKNPTAIAQFHAGFCGAVGGKLL